MDLMHSFIIFYDFNNFVSFSGNGTSHKTVVSAEAQKKTLA